MNVDARRMTEQMNTEWVLEGRTVAERAASWYRLGASPISAKAAVKREIDALPGGAATATKFWQSGKIKDSVAESMIVAEIQALERGSK